MKKGMTLTELLLAGAIAVVGMVLALALAADLLRAAAGVRLRQQQSLEGQVALIRLRDELGRAQSASWQEEGVLMTLDTGKIWWGVATQEGIPNLLRLSYPMTAAHKQDSQKAVATGVRALTYAPEAPGRTKVALTLRGGNYRLEERIILWARTM
jgi:hypothetical protein